MTIPFRIKKLTGTAKAPHRNCDSDLWDLYADDFSTEFLEDLKENNEFHGWYEDQLVIEERYTTILPDCEREDNYLGYWKMNHIYEKDSVNLPPQGRILCKTGIAIELPREYDGSIRGGQIFWEFQTLNHLPISSYAVADIRPRSGLSLKHGITVLNTPGTIDNSYRKEIGVILYNAGHEPYTINKGDKIAQMLIRPLYPSSMEVVEDFEDTGRGGFGSTGK